MSTKISFFREGHANNSSSTHNLIWTSKAKELSDSLDEDFGWDQFTCSSRESKMMYLTICLYRSYSHATGIKTYDSIIESEVLDAFIMKQFRKWVNEHIPMLKDAAASFNPNNNHIDHQSMLCFPYYRQSRQYINVEFAKDFVKEMVDGDYVILGGNDNGDNDHPLLDLNEEESNALSMVYLMIRDVESDSVFCVKDNKIGDYVLSSKNGTGNVMRVSFIHKPQVLKTVKAVDPDEKFNKALENLVIKEEDQDD